MRLRYTLLSLLLFFLFNSYLYAGTFIVTSNASGGAGTFREALEKAAANGSAETDTILFNLADLSRSGRTIILDTALPDLSAHIYIDGSSQPGPAFGISGAKVQIENNALLQYFIFFNAFNITGVDIYGLYLKGQNAGVGLSFNQTNEIHFGSPGKGNMINGCGYAVYADLQTGTDAASANLVFQSNLMGIDESGDITDFLMLNHQSFYLKNVRNLSIGGTGTGEGNLLCDQNEMLEVSYIYPDNAGYLKIQGNKIGTDRTGLKALTTSRTGDVYINGYNDGSDDPEGTTDANMEFTGNITTGRLQLFKIKNYFKISGNRFGVGADNVTSISNNNAYTIFFEFCPRGIIGGPDSKDKNYIAYAEQGVGEFHCGSITISRNSFFCHTGEGIGFYYWSYNTRPKPFVTINAYSTIRVAGTALPNSVIELFYDDECSLCEGKTYIASVTADVNGNWLYNGITGSAVVATATDTYGATTTFSSSAINTDSVVIKNATCGKNNGAIKRMSVISGTSWHWENSQGLIVGRDTNLVNVPSGRYKFVTAVANNDCKTESIFYEINNIERPVTDTTLISITQPNCGANNGALIGNISFSDSAQYQWMNAAGTIVNDDFTADNPFADLAPAEYFLHVKLKEDSTCFMQYGPFKLINQSGAFLNTIDATVENAACGKSNGSIKNITYQNAAGNIYIAWEDSTGKVIGNNLNLTGIAAGKYRLKMKDGGGCDTVVTAYYEVADNGSIHVDATGIQVSPSGCMGASGSITNIKQTNATQWKWIDSATQKTVGNNLDLTDVSAATYLLQLTNLSGCTASLGPIHITQAGFLPIAVTGSAIHNASCHLPNGSILVTRFDKDTASYHFTWKDSSNIIVGNNASLFKLGDGKYTLFATDSLGCQDNIFATTVLQSGSPVFDYTAMKITPDTCSDHKGGIAGFQATGGSGSLIWQWTDEAGNTIAANVTGIGNLLSNRYFATVADQNNCTIKTSPLFVDDIRKLVAVPEANDQFIPRNTGAIIKVINPGQGNYQLYDDAAATILLAAGAGGVFTTLPIAADRSFYIRYNDGDCMSALTKVNIKVFDSTIIYVPTAFTPNSDGANDRWKVTVQGRLLTYSIMIYNRYGSVVYSSADINSYWDGTIKSRSLPAGAFVYIINAKDYYNKNIRLSGSIVLVR